MRRMRFQAQELYILAAIAGKEKMYGIPNGFAGTSQREEQTVRQIITDSMLEEGIINMDFNGNYSISEKYAAIAEIYCDCNKCMTVNKQLPDGKAENLIFWRDDAHLFLAEIEGDYYCLRECDTMEVEARVSGESWTGVEEYYNSVFTIPQIALKKAKRFAIKNDSDNAIRILKQNGADERAAVILFDGLQETAHYLRLRLLNLKPDYCEEVEKEWLNSRGVILSLHQTVVNYRTCTCFTEVSEKSVEQGVREILANYLANG